MCMHKSSKSLEEKTLAVQVGSVIIRSTKSCTMHKAESKDPILTWLYALFIIERTDLFKIKPTINFQTTININSKSKKQSPTTHE